MRRTQQRYIDSYFVHDGTGNSPVIWREGEWKRVKAREKKREREKREKEKETETPDIMVQSLFESPRRTAPHTGLCYRRSASYANLSSYKHQPLWILDALLTTALPCIYRFVSFARICSQYGHDVATWRIYSLSCTIKTITSTLK